MKYSVAVKMLALFLCAACLLAAVGGGLGILVMTELELTDGNAEATFTRKLRDTAGDYAQAQMRYYASDALGGFPEDTLDTICPTAIYWEPFPVNTANYQILDSDGNVVKEQMGCDLKDPVAYRYQATGSYYFCMGVIAVEEFTPDAQAIASASVTNNIPAGSNAAVYRAEVEYPDNSGGISAETPIAVASYTESGTLYVAFTAGGNWWEDMDNSEPLQAVHFYGEDDELLYEASCTAGVGTFHQTEDGEWFESYAFGTDTGGSALIDNLPLGKNVTVAGIKVGWDGGSTELYFHELGYLCRYEDGTVGFSAASFDAFDATPGDPVTDICFTDADGDILYSASSPDGVGRFFYNTRGGYCFQSTLTEADTGIAGTVNDYINAYEYPDLSSNVLTSLGTGFQMNITRTANVDGVDWGYIPDMGWVLMEQVTLTEDSQAEQMPETASARSVEPVFYQGLTTAAVTGYAIPEKNVEEVGSAEVGCTITVYQQTADGTWLYTDIGWVEGETVTLSTRDNGDDADEILQTATLAVTNGQPVWEQPTEDAKQLTPCAAGTTLILTAQKNVAGTDWALLSGGGWVKVEDLTLLDTTAPTLPQAEPVETLEPVETEPEDDTLTFHLTPLPDGISEDVTTQEYWDGETGLTMRVSYSQVPMPDYTMVVYLEKDIATYYPYYGLVELVCNLHSSLYLLLIGGLLLFAVLAVYLCCAAGRKPRSEEVHPSGFNVLPLDLYLLAGGCGILGLLLLVDWGTSDTLMQKNWEFCVGLGLGAGYVGCLILVGFCFAFAAQVKTPGGYWWRNTLCIRLPVACWRLCRWLWRTLGKILGFLLPRGKRLVLWCCNLVKTVFRWLWNGIDRLLKLLPLTWQWLLAGAAMFLLMLLAVANRGLVVPVCLGGCVAIVVYGARCFGILAESVKRMSRGDLDTQVEDPWMLGSFREFAGDLNGLAGVAVVAAQKQLKSERMKTELITNVSHDIKTPLTSIINYVDLLQKPHTEEEGAQYLEVLDRQSQRLKKLIEDLMEMSKASTGNMAVDAKPLDAAEAVNQALGEFADKLAAAQLVPVFRRPEQTVTMLADGRLTWRVLSNLLGNAVKYALPGTRLYIDLAVLEGKVVLSLKNISREELNVAAEELMERFVRGDSSRNTEGSGLGLNIAKSLMELQKGSLQLLVDGDLFKVTLIFPEATQ